MKKICEDETKLELYHGDCREKLKLLDKESVHLLITDPPYFLDGLDNKWSKGDKAENQTGIIKGVPSGMKFDKRQGVNLQTFIFDVATLAIEVMKPGAFGLIFSNPRLSHRMGVGLEDAGFEIRDMYVWHYQNKSRSKSFGVDHFVNNMDIDESKKQVILEKIGGRKTAQLRPQFDIIILCQKPKENTIVKNWLEHETGLIDVDISELNGTPSTLMSFNKESRESYNNHPTVKPVKLMAFLIKMFSKKGHIVLDPFLGSGTTALACKYTNRNYIGIEINHDYINIINNRVAEKSFFDTIS